MARAGVKFTSNRIRVERDMEGRVEAALESGIRVWQHGLLKAFTGERSGRLYRVPGTKVLYRASAPTESPAMPTGITRRSYRTATAIDRAEAYLGSALDVAVWLERGTRHMAKREAIKPALMARKAEIERVMIEALKQGGPANAR